MKTAITLLLLLPCLVFSQIAKTDTINLPAQVQQTVKNIEYQRQLQDEISRKMSAELDKIAVLSKKISQKLENMKASRQVKPKDSTRVAAKFEEVKGLKPDEYEKLIQNPDVMWEQRPKSRLGRLLSKKKYRYVPYIINENADIIYLNTKK